MVELPTAVTSGVRKFLRAQQLPMEEYQRKQVADVFDLCEAIELITSAWEGTSRFIGNQMHQTSAYDPAEDVKRELEELLFYGDTDQEVARQRRRNLTMYHLIMEPWIDHLSTVGHSQAIIDAKQLRPIIQEYVLAFNDYGNEDDAVVANHQIKAMVKVREEARRTRKLAMKKANRRKPRIDDMIDMD